MSLRVAFVWSRLRFVLNLVQLRAFLGDDTGSVLAEYALVMAGLTITGVIAFYALANGATNSVTRDESNFTNTALVAP